MYFLTGFILTYAGLVIHVNIIPIHSQRQPQQRTLTEQYMPLLLENTEKNLKLIGKGPS